MDVNTNVQYQPLRDISNKIFSGAPIYGFGNVSKDMGGIPVINIKNIIESQIDIASLSFLNPENIRDFERFEVRPDDVVITCRGTQLKVALVPRELKRAIITANLIAIRLNERLSPVFLAAYLKTKEGQRALLANAKSSTMQLVLNVSDIERVEIPLLPLNLQEKIVNLINSSETQYRLSIESANMRREITNQMITDLLKIQGG